MLVAVINAVKSRYTITRYSWTKARRISPWARQKTSISRISNPWLTLSCPRGPRAFLDHALQRRGPELDGRQPYRPGADFAGGQSRRSFRRPELTAT